MHLYHGPRWLLASLLLASTALILGMAAGCGGSSSGSASQGLPTGKATLAQVQRGQYLVTSLSCADCHNRGKDDPNDPNWLAGFIGAAGGQGAGAFTIGPWKSYAANLTPDMTNGIGMHTDRQIFNALRYGLDPMQTPDMQIEGTNNFPANPVYLLQPMPWPSFRHLTDADTWAIIAYLKHGIAANSNAVPASTGPPYNPTAAQIGPQVIPGYGQNASEKFSP